VVTHGPGPPASLGAPPGPASLVEPGTLASAEGVVPGGDPVPPLMRPVHPKTIAKLNERARLELSNVMRLLFEQDADQDRD